MRSDRGDDRIGCRSTTTSIVLMSAQALDNLSLLRFVNQCHNAFFDVQFAELIGGHFIFNINQSVSNTVNVVGSHLVVPSF